MGKIFSVDSEPKETARDDRRKRPVPLEKSSEMPLYRVDKIEKVE